MTQSPDPSEEMLKENPLIRFSVYSEIQRRIVCAFAVEVYAEFDRLPQGNDGTIDGGVFNRAYGLFWLWLLGAYELIRTMSAGRDCFVSERASEITTLKHALEVMRIPFAKQELRRKKIPLAAELSVVGFGERNNDLHFLIQDETHSARELMGRTERFLQSLTHEDVLADFRRSKNFPGN